MKKFEINKYYEMKFIGDSDLKPIFKCINRTEKTVTLKSIIKNEIIKKKIRVLNNEEYILNGNYSMAPSIKANPIILLRKDQNCKNRNYIKIIEFNGENFTLHKISNDPFKTLFYLNTIKGEPYIDINKIIPTSLLLFAIWVEVGSKEEKIADILQDILQKTDRTTESGFNQYVMYNIISL